MAETAKKALTPAAAVPPPAEPAAVETKATRSESKFLNAMSKLLTATVWFCFGIGFILLGILNHRFDLIPAVMKQPLLQLIPHLSYFLVGLGLLCIGQLRSGIQNDYSAEYKKNKQFSHAWKIPLFIAEVWIYRIIGVYGIAVGVGKLAAVKNLMGLIGLLVGFLLYLLWYAIAFMKNRFPTFATFRIAAFLGLVPAIISILFWISQFIFLSLVFAILALIATMVSLFSSSSAVEQRLNGMKLLCAAGTFCLILIIMLNALPYGKPCAELKGLGLASKDPVGEIGILSYSPEQKSVLNNPDTSTRQKLAFSLKTKEGWVLQIIDAKADETVVPNDENYPKEVVSKFVVKAGEEAFHPYFVEGGKAILLDGVKGGKRGLWKVDTSTGLTTILRRSGVQPFTDGSPWSEKTKQFLYVTADDSGYKLNAYPEGKAKKALFRSTSPILSPSWTMSGEDIAYTDGNHGLFNVLNLASGKSTALISDQEMAENFKPKDMMVKEVLPAPDGFRYLYLAEEGKKTTLWSVLADGTKREQIYDVQGSIQDLTWYPDGQKILFEEKRNRAGLLNLFYPYGFLTESRRVRLLDANLETAQDLILPQVSHRAPAISPDGVKVAFVADQGLWLRQGSTAIWVAHLR